VQQVDLHPITGDQADKLCHGKQLIAIAQLDYLQSLNPRERNS
jgi:hypothetical protein